MTDPIEYFAGYLAKKAKTWDQSLKVSEEDISYHLAIWLNYHGVIVLSIIIGLSTGRILESVLGLCTLILMRAVTGGVHAPSMTACFLITSALIFIASKYSLPLFSINLINIVSALILIWYNKNRHNKEVVWALSIILLNSLLQSSAVAVVGLAQCLTLFGTGGERDD